MNTIRNFSKTLILPVFAALIAALFVSCSGSSELSGVYEGVYELSYGNRTFNKGTYKVTFMEGHTFKVELPRGDKTSGTYKVEGKTIQGDIGFAKLIYQIVDDQTLSTTWEGDPLQLKKRP